ncbi:Aldo/keto reductase [Flagelloscypha sp. PMI_526]|nr:Aldo/keto reductase [Flagelloscypha sp. PMI_526]
MSFDEKHEKLIISAPEWGSVKLNDGNTIPQAVGFGTWKRGNGDFVIDLVGTALESGFSHIDTAEIYRNEEEVGQALRNSGLSRDEFWITTKFPHLDNNDPVTALKGSLTKLGLDYVDLYLVHHPRIALPDIPTVWKSMEEIKRLGLAKSIGVSNFEISHLTVLLENAEIIPAVNQIEFHPYNYSTQLPLVKFCEKLDIVIEGYSPLTPLTSRPNGPLSGPLESIAEKHKATPDQILLAWSRAKGAVVITSSTKKTRIEGYIDGARIALSEDEISTIDAAGAANIDVKGSGRLVLGGFLASAIWMGGLEYGRTHFQC